MRNNNRGFLSGKDIEHIREKLKELYNLCRDRRFRKARRMMGENDLYQEGLNGLERTPHFDKDSQSLEGLPYCIAIQSQVVQSGASHLREKHTTVGGSERFRGRFIDRNVMNFQEDICYQERWYAYQRD